jgi:small subunit ribosomal protein S8
MSMTDPIADMLTRIRNANQAFHHKVDVPASRLKEEIAALLKAEGYISEYKFIEDRRQGILRVYLKYTPKRERVLAGLKRVSTPSRRVYVRRDAVPRVLRGLGMAILSTSQGIMSDSEARRRGVGGEVVCHVW